MTRTQIFFFAFISLLVLTGASRPANATLPRVEVKRIVIEEATRANVPVDLALAVAKVESDFNPRARSSVGARGVMQIMPNTARGEFGLTPNRLWDPRTNIRTGVAFLRQLYEQYDQNWEHALSHYNGGTLKGGRPHSYTKSYVQSVMKWRRIYGEQANIWSAIRNVSTSNSFVEEDENDTEVADVDLFAEDEPITIEKRKTAKLEIEEWQPPAKEYNVIEEWVEPEVEETITVVERPTRSVWMRPPPPPHHFDYRRPPPRPRHLF